MNTELERLRKDVDHTFNSWGKVPPKIAAERAHVDRLLEAAEGLRLALNNLLAMTNSESCAAKEAHAAISTFASAKAGGKPFSAEEKS